MTDALFHGPFDDERWRNDFREFLFGDMSPFRLPARGWHTQVRRSLISLAGRPMASEEDMVDLDNLQDALSGHDGIPRVERGHLEHSLAEYRRLRFAEFDGEQTREEIETSRRVKHWGSAAHVGFGRIVGAALGVHPVFAACLRPFGGIVGPGHGWGGFSRFLARCDRLQEHAVAHDACGYLYLVHSLGPGYAYLAPGVPVHPNRGRYTTGHRYFFSRSAQPWRLLGLEPLLEGHA